MLLYISSIVYLNMEELWIRNFLIDMLNKVKTDEIDIDTAAEKLSNPFRARI